MLPHEDCEAALVELDRRKKQKKEAELAVAQSKRDQSKGSPTVLDGSSSSPRKEKEKKHKKKKSKKSRRKRKFPVTIAHAFLIQGLFLQGWMTTVWTLTKAWDKPTCRDRLHVFNAKYYRYYTALRYFD